MLKCRWQNCDNKAQVIVTESRHRQIVRITRILDEDPTVEPGDYYCWADAGLAVNAVMFNWRLAQ